MNWDLYSWVVRGSQRRKVIEAMSKPKIATQISKDTKISVTHVSKVLKSFSDRGVARCLTPRVRIGKLYALTDKGEAIRREILRNGN